MSEIFCRTEKALKEGEMNRLHGNVKFWMDMLAVLPVLLAAGCDGGGVKEPAYPNQEQVVEAVVELLENEPPDALGPAIEEILVSRAPEGIEDNFLTPPGTAIMEFKCGPRACACVEGAGVPEDKKEEWSCDGMGAACAAKGFVPKFPCSTLSIGTLCVCIHPKGVFQ